MNVLILSFISNLLLIQNVLIKERMNEFIYSFYLQYLHFTFNTSWGPTNQTLAVRFSLNKIYWNKCLFIECFLSLLAIGDSIGGETGQAQNAELPTWGQAINTNPTPRYQTSEPLDYNIVRTGKYCFYYDT